MGRKNLKARWGEQLEVKWFLGCDKSDGTLSKRIQCLKGDDVE
jgi:hypothetical protein